MQGFTRPETPERAAKIASEKGQKLVVSPIDQRRFAELLRRLERYETLTDSAFEILPRLRETAAKLDSASSKLLSRKRGQREKLTGGLLFEDAVVEVVKTLKDEFKQDGHGTSDAWTMAREAVAIVAGVRPATLEDWIRGAKRRERQKPIEARSYRRRKRNKLSPD